MIGIFGLVEGVNYPTRRDKDESFLDVACWDNIIITDVDFFINNHGKILQWAKRSKGNITRTNVPLITGL
jgi:hypothetical protein